MTDYEIYPVGAEELCQSLNIERYISQKERDSYDSADFAGPDESFPITSQAQLDAAAHLIGHAADPDAVKRKAIAIAKRKGFKLPAAWQEEKSEDRAQSADEAIPDPENTPTLALTSAEQDGKPETPTEERSVFPSHASLIAPITRIDTEKWEVEGIATSEAVDSYGTIFSYEASKQAFKNWIERTANVREMHDRKAVGKGVGVFFDDSNKQVVVRLRISKGARDTWTKITEGVLSGLSVGATNYTWDKIERGGKSYPYLSKYDLAELSVVDQASNPDGQGLAICRADGLLTELVDVTEENTISTHPSLPLDSLLSSSLSSVERAGARVSGGTRAAMHTSIAHTLHAALAQMQNCGCDCCMEACAMIDPDGDGDIDLGGYDDPDGDAEQLYAAKQQDDMERMIRQTQERLITEVIERILPAAVERVLAPVYTRQQSFLARMAQTPELPEITIPSFDTAALEERLITSFAERMAASTSGLAEVHASLAEQSQALGAVKELVERIAAQPAPGGPVLNGGGALPVDKRLANQGHTSNLNDEQAIVRKVLDRLQASGALNSIEAQTAVAAMLLQPAQATRIHKG